MNAALAGYYGVGPAEKQSSAADNPLRPLHLMRRVVEHLDGASLPVSKESAASLQAFFDTDRGDAWGSVRDLGTPEEALQKCSGHLAKIRAWQRGDADGIEVARQGILATFERAHRGG